MKPGKLIVFEGGDGSGKSSHIRLSARRLRARGYAVVTTHEPGGTGLGVALRKFILQSKHCPVQKAELFLFLADRAQHVTQVIEPALKSGAIVLCDRFTGSTLSYQIGGRGLKPDKLIRAMEQFSRSNLKPSRTIYLDVAPNIGIHRKNSQPAQFTRFENETSRFHQAVRRYFRKLVKQQQWKILNANRPLTVVQADVNRIIDQLCP